ncbi:MAG: class I SAM-dependent methyltransferase [Candidatus Rokuibacteriota bacterium]
MRQTPNPQAFEDAVRTYLEPSREQFNYAQMLHTFLSTDRFHQWAAVIATFRPLDGARFLSSGCGFGGSLLAYRDAGACPVVGVEVDEDYLRFAGLRARAVPGAGVVAYDGHRLPFPDGAFTLIESMDVVEHTTDAGAYLSELHRVLAPGGAILLVTPNRLWPIEQHLGIVGPPWLPVPLADLLFGLLGRLPFVPAERRFRYRKLRGMRTQNVSLRRLRRLARERGLFLRLLRPGDHAGPWPLPQDPALIRRLSRHRVGKFLAPTRTLVVLLERS